MVKLSDIELPMIFENKLLFSHGFHNKWNIMSSEIDKSLSLTDWEDQQNRSLYLSHSERDAQAWVGRIINPHVVNGSLFGDLEIHDADLALKLGPGKAPLGVSAEIRWPQQYNDPTDFTYTGFAMVPNPEVPETRINFSKKENVEYNNAKIYTPFIDNQALFANQKKNGKVTEVDYSEEEFAKVTAMEEKRKQLGMSVGEFYAAPRDPPSASALPIFDASHVRNALARFNQTKFLSDSEKTRARGKITTAAKKFGIEVSANFSIITSQTAKGSPIGEEDSNLMSAERGFESKMEENKEENITPETEEEKVEDTKATTEETEEEGTEEAEDKEAKFSKFDKKFEDLSARVVTLEENQAKFSEESEKSEETEEESESKKEAIAESESEESESEEVEDNKEEGVKTEESEAKFSELAEQVGKLAAAIEKKEAAPMSTAEFGTKGADKENNVIDRLTKSLSK